MRPYRAKPASAAVRATAATASGYAARRLRYFIGAAFHPRRDCGPMRPEMPRRV
jgi:hypothetical protein